MAHPATCPGFFSLKQLLEKHRHANDSGADDHSPYRRPVVFIHLPAQQRQFPLLRFRILLCVGRIVQGLVQQRRDLRKVLGKFGELFDDFFDFGFRT